MDEKIHYIGKYRFKDNAGRYHEPYWESPVVFNGQRRSVVDASGLDENGLNFVQLVPYKPDKECPQINAILCDGDLLAYVQAPQKIEIPSGFHTANAGMLQNVKDLLKGRANHAELGYKNAAGQAMQVSMWERPDPTRAEDREFFKHTDRDTINIYRVSLGGYDVDSRREALLKAEVKRWKELAKCAQFPCKEKRDIDPVDFTTMDELRKIAEGYINHSPEDPNQPFKFDLNCVQWSTLVFSLAVCFPLSETMLKEAGLLQAYKANWAEHLGYAEDGLVGIKELPMPSYTAKEIAEDFLDLYLPEHKPELMKELNQLPLHQLLGVRGGADDKRIMPNAFMIENRLRGLHFERKTKSIFRYIATAAPEEELQTVP